MTRTNNKWIVTCGFIVMLLKSGASPIKAQIETTAWQRQAQSLNVNQDISKRTAGLLVAIKADQEWPIFQLQGGVSSFSNALVENEGIDLGQLRLPDAAGYLSNQAVDWSHNQLSFGTSLQVWASRLSPAVLVHTDRVAIELFSGNVKHVIRQGSTLTAHSAVTNSPSQPKYIAYPSTAGITVQALSTTPIDLTSLSENWILVWYGQNSHFADSRVPTSYTNTVNGRINWDLASTPISDSYQADAPVFISFQNKPLSIAQNATNGGAVITLGGGTHFVSWLPLFGREHPDAALTESWGTNRSLPANVTDRIGLWKNYRCFFPETVTESYSWEAGVAAIHENISFQKVCEGGSKYLPIPPVVGVANEVFPVHFSGQVIDTGIHTAFGPIMGIRDDSPTLTTSYSWNIGALDKYISDTRILSSGPVPAGLTNQLTAEIDRLFDSQNRPLHFDPWLFSDHAPQDAVIGYSYWVNPADTIYQLVETAPALPPATQEKIKTYLISEIQAFPPDTVANVPFGVGLPRDMYGQISVDAYNQRKDTFREHFGFQDSLPLYNFYSMASYYSFTRDTIPQATWTNALTTLNRELNEQDWATLYWFKQRDHRPNIAVENTNRHFAGLIGLAKLAHLKGDTAASRLVQSFIAKTAVLRVAMAHYPRYYAGHGLLAYPANPNWQLRYSAGKWHGHIWKYDWTNANQDHRQVRDLNQFEVNLYDHASRDWNEIGPNPYLITFKDMVPEVGRFLKDTVAAETRIFTDTYTANYPNWYTIYSESGLAREHAYHHPQDSYQILLAKEWIEELPASELHQVLDIPWLEAGDFFYLHKLAETVKAYRGWCWSTDGTNCDSGTPPTGGPTPPPTTPTVLPGDADNDRDVDYPDLLTLLTQFGRQLTTIIDWNRNGQVDIFDFNLVVTYLH